ncbi:aminopeptidase P family protein [Rhodobaculum claviforme]|uniref:X-Pro aminopeptidase n=1 Tax=Rhodobaculum claviforme TaxID=1549854 RepID=A0A934WKC2_9RHOB|nr:aminopeptidase P family protein [Rhodobaculum claviforme]MBK5928408.1 X-Pro aminopeptidase [Rhodobaculum claviforme]
MSAPAAPGHQGFDAATRPDQGPPRLAALRGALAAAGLQGFIVPRADVHQGENVAPRDERLAWLTGFTGSAGMAVVLPTAAAVFVDGRYRVQVRAQVDTDHFTPVNWPATRPSDWLREAAPNGAIVAYDPWLHTRDELRKLEASLQGSGITLQPTNNFIDQIWTDRPAPPRGAIRIHPAHLTGETSADKRARLAEGLRRTGHRAAVLSLPDSVCWLLNIRGADIARTPVVQAFAILHDDARADLFLDPGRLDAALRDHLSNVTVHAPDTLPDRLRGLDGPVRLDPGSAPVALADLLGAGVAWAEDPCLLPKACKTEAELAGMRAAHLRDGAAVVEFLAWLYTAPGPLSEIAVVEALEGFRAATGQLDDISFDTIAGSGPHGAIVHYRVTRDTDRPLAGDAVLLVDSGGQYPDGTTDITRTLAIGPPTPEVRAAFTRVLRGLIAVSRLRWPRGLAGRDLDALARAPLWLAGQDYDHGTGHGVGAALGVHEGPQRLSRQSEVPLVPGMVLSNEPGYYREGAFGIRLENLVAVVAAPPLPDGDDRPMLAFETLTWAPFDRRLIDPAALPPEDRDWLDAYHRCVDARLSGALSPAARDWLARATAPLGHGADKQETAR